MIRVIGFGIKGFSQLTLEAVEAMRQSRKVLLLGKKDRYFEALNIPHVESLLPLYRNGDQDFVNYRRILDKVLSDERTYRDISVLYPGHPRVGVTLVQWLNDLAARNEVELQVVVGVSSFDTMMNDLCTDPLERGTAIMDANRMLLFQQEPDPSLDLYIYHVCSVGNAQTHYLDASQGNQIQLLKEHLLKFYPENWEVRLVRSSERPESPARVIIGNIGALEALLTEISFSTTLFVPGMKPKKLNREFLARIRAS